MSVTVFTVVCERNGEIDDAVALAGDLGLQYRPVDAEMGRGAIEIFINSDPSPILHKFKDAGFAIEERA